MAKERPLTAYVRQAVTALLRSPDGPTQEDVATLVGVPQQRISDLASGEWRNPPLDVLNDVLGAYNVTLAQLLAGYQPGRTATNAAILEIHGLLPDLSLKAQRAVLVQCRAHKRGQDELLEGPGTRRRG